LPTAEELDYEITPEETYQVLDADSSQQEAIIAAKRGVSFIVQGPPGTGKSQTIANIIAECLGADRTVLFVSAKMAALEVVKKRLDTHGLGQFCLELHSHKANKKRVITELGNTLDAPISAKAVSSKKIQQLSELQKLREKLNSYVLALHKKRTQLNVSAFQIHGELASLEEAKDLRFKVPNIGDITHETLETIDSLLDRLVSMGHVLDNYQEHPWKGCNLTKYTFEMQNSVYEQFERFKKSVNNIEKRCSNLAQLMSIQAPQTLSNCGTTCKRAEHLVNTPKPPKSWFNNSTLDQIGMHAIKAEDTQTKYKRGKQDILSKYSEDVYSLNIKQLYVRFIREYDSIFRIFKGNFRADMKL
jgi:DNA polymerase III delta prime subunit